ncbi:MAG: PhnD/SsuA/transferrin family substrate-binding protein [Rhodocyclaceae bacterium]|nr:PhnD/SsuA/transferrin family substrate-binding protein [Rhodocyclaceae bacterium]
MLRPDYTCALVASAETRITPKAIKGKTIALTQPLSTCGYFVADTLLRQAGGALEHNRYRYLGRHDAVALAVIRGEFEVGALKTSIAESGLLPGFLLAANAKTIKVERLAQIRQALLEADTAVLATTYRASIEMFALATETIF